MAEIQEHKSHKSRIGSTDEDVHRSCSVPADDCRLIRSMLGGPNHLILIGPDDCCIRELINGLLKEVPNPSVVVDVTQAATPAELADMLRSRIRTRRDGEKTSRGVPTACLQAFDHGLAPLEWALNDLEKHHSEDCRAIADFHEFSKIDKFGSNAAGFLRGIMQFQNHVTYAFTGSDTEAMTAMFLDRRSPFFQFGFVMNLSRFPSGSVGR